ncbi:hypothetical protein GGI35DRAFT_89056 [Trichoderma velutinum]
MQNASPADKLLIDRRALLNKRAVSHRLTGQIRPSHLVSAPPCRLLPAWQLWLEPLRFRNPFSGARRSWTLNEGRVLPCDRGNGKNRKREARQAKEKRGGDSGSTVAAPNRIGNAVKPPNHLAGQSRFDQRCRASCIASSLPCSLLALHPTISPSSESLQSPASSIQEYARSVLKEKAKKKKRREKEGKRKEEKERTGID